MVELLFFYRRAEREAKNDEIRKKYGKNDLIIVKLISVQRV